MTTFKGNRLSIPVTLQSRETVHALFVLDRHTRVPAVLSIAPHVPRLKIIASQKKVKRQKACIFAYTSVMGGLRSVMQIRIFDNVTWGKKHRLGRKLYFTFRVSRKPLNI